MVLQEVYLIVLVFLTNLEKNLNLFTVFPYFEHSLGFPAITNLKRVVSLVFREEGVQMDPNTEHPGKTKIPGIRSSRDRIRKFKFTLF